MVIASAAWLLLTFDPIYLASFPLSRFGAALPGTVATVELSGLACWRTSIGRSARFMGAMCWQ